MIKAVIFDMDGLMTDTERLFIDIWCQVLSERGMPENRDVVTHCIGLDHGRTRAYVSEKLGEDFDFVNIMGEINRRAIRHYEEKGVPLKEGLYELLDYLDEQGIPYGVATSTKRDNGRFRLDKIGVLSRLSGLVTGDMVEKGKPEPDIFRKAAEAIGVPAGECMVLEDSPHGILAAHRAGCIPVMIPDLKEPDAETLAMLFARRNSLLEIPDLLESMNRNT